MIHTVLIFTNAEAENEYTLIFEGYESHMKSEFNIGYTGTEVYFYNKWCAITDEQKEKLKECLNDQYGYGPFDERKVKKDFEQNIRYEL